jgi:predicted RNA polymerase sigma factor
VPAVVYLLFNEGCRGSTAKRAQARDLVEAAVSGGHRGLPRRGRELRRHRLGADPRAGRHAAAPGALTGHPPAPGRRRTARRRPRAGPEPALAELDELGDALERHPLFFATRAELLRDLGRDDEARRADERALRLTASPARQALLEQRLGWD